MTNQQDSPSFDLIDEFEAESIRKRKVSRWMNLGCGIAVAIALVCLWLTWISRLANIEEIYTAREQSERDAQAGARKTENEAHSRELARLDSQHRARLADAKLIDGTRAREVHEIEWGKRQAHDPSLADTPIEQKLIEMERIGADAQISAQGALLQVAKLASPPGSRVEVKPVGDSFAVRVAFPMSAVALGEKGATTKHTSHAGMRAEIRQILAWVVRDLFSYCGSRGIDSIALTCNHTTLRWIQPPGATEEELKILRSRARKVQSRLYRVVMEGSAARNVADWRHASEDDVLKLVKIDLDSIDAVMISSEVNSDDTDSTDPLQF
jgi:hypothetical protein